MDSYDIVFQDTSSAIAPPMVVISSNYQNSKNSLKFICKKQSARSNHLKEGWYWTRLKVKINGFGKKKHFYLIHLDVSLNDLYIITFFKDM